MKVEFIIKTAKARGYKVYRSTTSNEVYAEKGNWYRAYQSYNDLYNNLLKCKKA